MIHPWHDVTPGELIQQEFSSIIEIPFGSSVKYELDKETGLLRLDRVEEFLLFLYSHRFHDHTPGSWTAGEVAGINGGTATFCIPAQQNHSHRGALDAGAGRFR